VAVAEENIVHAQPRICGNLFNKPDADVDQKGLISKAEAKSFVEGLISSLHNMPDEVEQMLAEAILANIDQIQENPTSFSLDRNWRARC
jgi:hypothetical protein